MINDCLMAVSDVVMRRPSRSLRCRPGRDAPQLRQVVRQPRTLLPTRYVPLHELPPVQLKSAGAKQGGTSSHVCPWRCAARERENLGWVPSVCVSVGVPHTHTHKGHTHTICCAAVVLGNLLFSFQKVSQCLGAIETTTRGAATEECDESGRFGPNSAYVPELRRRRAVRACEGERVQLRCTSMAILGKAEPVDR